MSADRNRGFFIRLAWWQTAVFVVIAAVATYFRGFQSAVVIGWVAVIMLSVIGLCNAYGVSRKIQAGGSFILAAFFATTSAFWRDGWGVSQSELLDMAVGTTALSVWLLALDARTGEPVPLVRHVAGALTAVMLLVIAAMATSGDANQAHLLRIGLASAILVALYDLSDKKWQVPLAIIAFIVVVFMAVWLYQMQPNP